MLVLLWISLPIVLYLYMLSLHFFFWNTYKSPERFIPQWWREYDIRGGRLKNPKPSANEDNKHKYSYSDRLSRLTEELQSAVDNIGLYRRSKEPQTVRECLARIKLYAACVCLELLSIGYLLVVTPIVLSYSIGLILYTISEARFLAALSFILKDLSLK